MIFRHRILVTLLLTGLMACSDAKKNVSQENLNYYSLGMKEYKKGNYDAAIKFFNKATEIDSTNDRLFFYKALSYEYLEKVDSSIISFDRAIICKPENARYNLFRGHGYRKIGKFEEALADYKTAIQKSDKVDFEAHFNLATLDLELKDRSGACDNLKVIYGQGFARADSIYEANCK